MRNKLLILIGLLLVLSSCEDYFEPKISNERTYDQLLNDPDMVRGLLTYAYRSIPSNYDSFDGNFLDCSTDNAISNELEGSNLYNMQARDGYWTSRTNPLNSWNARYDDLKYVNQFIQVGLSGEIVFIKASDEENERMIQRLKGEAYFLRAWIHFDLLRRFAGVDQEGNLMGIPLITEVLDINEELTLKRSSYKACVDQILADIQTALSAGLPEVYDGTGVLDETNVGRPTTVACKALKSRVLLYAASPAFSIETADKTVAYAAAAQAAMDVVDDHIGTVLPDVYSGNVDDNYFADPNNQEVIMRRIAGGTGGNRDWEERSFPPASGLFGSGRCNPTQNLVDAFPMVDGYPYNASNDANMYVDRDPRLSHTVIYNNAAFKGQNIETYIGGNNMPGAAGVTDENSTQTGYYLRKWLNAGVSLVPGSETNTFHYNALFRKAEIFLNLAEAANEAYGPDGGSLGMTAREAIAEVRRRAGIAAGSSDDYLASLTTKEQLRALIKNERRIELCFEGHRYFDVRRWKDNLNAPIVGVRIIKEADDSFTITRENKFTPVYRDYMYYGPIPQNEINKTGGAIVQNQGW